MKSVLRQGRDASSSVDAERGAHGERIGKAVGVDNPAAMVLKATPDSLFAVTRLVSQDPEHGVTASVGREDAYIVTLELQDCPAHPFWADGRETLFAPKRRGQASILDLNLGVGAYLRFPFNSLHMYVPRPVLDAATDALEAPRIESLHAPRGVPVDDEVIGQIGGVLLTVLEAPERANRLFLDHLVTAFGIHLAQIYGKATPRSRLKSGGLSPLQERRAKELLLSRLDGEIGVGDLARECGLSKSHFSRAFKSSVGQPPHRWLLAQRIERACRLLLDSTEPLAAIATRTGFADQSHFTAAFVRATGTSPGQWRRARRG